MSQETDWTICERIRKGLATDLSDLPDADIKGGTSEADGCSFVVRIGETKHTLEIGASALLQAGNQGVGELLVALQRFGWDKEIHEQDLLVTMGTNNNYVVGPYPE